MKLSIFYLYVNIATPSTPSSEDQEERDDSGDSYRTGEGEQSEGQQSSPSSTSRRSRSPVRRGPLGKWRLRSRSPYFKRSSEKNTSSPELPMVNRRRLQFLTPQLSRSSAPKKVPTPRRNVVTPRLGTKSPGKRKSSREAHTCNLCQKRFSKLKDHLKGRKRKLDKASAKELMRSVTLPVKTKDGRYRSRYPIAGCGDLVGHLRLPLRNGRQHRGTLSEREVNRLCAEAEVYVPQRLDHATPTKKSEPSKQSASPTETATPAPQSAPEPTPQPTPGRSQQQAPTRSDRPTGAHRSYFSNVWSTLCWGINFCPRDKGYEMIVFLTLANTPGWWKSVGSGSRKDQEAATTWNLAVRRQIKYRPL